MPYIFITLYIVVVISLVDEGSDTGSSCSSDGGTLSATGSGGKLDRKEQEDLSFVSGESCV